jgi:Phosphotransferase enzyme family
MGNNALIADIAPLWERSLGAAVHLRLTPGPVSGNNRVFIADSGERRAVVKWYFRGPASTRDRMESEWRMLTYAGAAGVESTPRPYARDEVRGLVLMEWIDGKKLAPQQIGSHEVGAAADFLRQLSCLDSRSRGADLPDAAEACFTTTAHFDVMQRRLDRLRFSPRSDVERHAARLLDEMRRFWSDIRPVIADELKRLGIDPQKLIPRSQQCVSPADFGFHNALMQPDGRLRFFDFEYAGWDDPAKTLCDFFLAPATPVPFTYWDEFASRAFADWPPDAAIRERASVLMPLFALKWCCIMLNPFVPVLASPGAFAAPDHDLEERKALQIAKAERAFGTLVERVRRPSAAAALQQAL